MTHINIGQFSEELAKDTLFGLGFLTIVLLVNVFLFMQIFFWFMRASDRDVKTSSYTLIARFMSTILMMSLVQLVSILIWATALYMNGLVDSLKLSLLFAGSCYTTLGIFADILPTGWQALAFYIAFSGLFSFAIATSAMMSMLSVISKRLYKSAA